jgi:release factor glutamine methyltransferase
MPGLQVNAEAGAVIGELVRDSGLPKPEAELLLCVLMGRERAYLIAHRDEAIDPFDADRARNWFARRRFGEPIAYITARREFYGIPLRVTPEVLIPRPETERLVDLALERVPANASARALDLGTGSGAIAVALARGLARLRITATDVSAAALAVARENARCQGVEIEFLRSDWFASLEPEPFDLIVSNPPYVKAGDKHLEIGDVRFEPRIALVGGDSGLNCIERIAAQARARLRPGGWLILEHGYDQRNSCLELFHSLGYVATEDFDDLAGIPRACAGRWGG